MLEPGQTLYTLTDEGPLTLLSLAPYRNVTAIEVVRKPVAGDIVYCKIKGGTKSLRNLTVHRYGVIGFTQQIALDFHLTGRVAYLTLDEALSVKDNRELQRNFQQEVDSSAKRGKLEL